MSQGTDLVFEKYRQNLAQNEKPRVMIGGTFLRLAECAYPVTVRLLGDNGRIIGSMDNVLAGDYVRDIPFAGFIIENTNTAQYVSVQVASSGVGTDRVLGEVSVINGELARVKANNCFIGQGSVAAVAGQYSHVQLSNQAGSGRNLVLNKASVYAPGVTPVYLATYDIQLALLGAGYSKLRGGANSAAATVRGNASASVLGQVVGMYAIEVAGQSKDFQFSEPMVLTPGTGVCLIAVATNLALTGSFQWNEENI